MHGGASTGARSVEGKRRQAEGREHHIRRLRAQGRKPGPPKGTGGRPRKATRVNPVEQLRVDTLAALGESKVGDRPALGVRISVKGRKDLRFFFDKESGLLVKSEHILDDGNGKESRDEVALEPVVALAAIKHHFEAGEADRD